MSEEKRIKEFINYIDGVVKGREMRAMYYDMPREFLYRYGADPCNYTHKTEECLVVSIPKSTILGFIETQEWYKQNRAGFPMDRLDDIIRRYHNEKTAREENPAAKKAWEQYRLLLKLSTSDDVIDDL